MRTAAASRQGHTCCIAAERAKVIALQSRIQAADCLSLLLRRLKTNIRRKHPTIEAAEGAVADLSGITGLQHRNTRGNLHECVPLLSSTATDFRRHCCRRTAELRIGTKYYASATALPQDRSRCGFQTT